MRELLLVIMLGLLWIGFAAFLVRLGTRDKVTSSMKPGEVKPTCPPHKWAYVTIRGIAGMNCTQCGFRAGIIENDKDF